MQSILQDAANLLVSSPGNLVYHLVVAFSIAGALLIAFQHWRREDTQIWRRLLIGLSVLFALRLLVFAAAGLALQDLVDSRIFLPPTDRVVNAISLSVIIWLLIAPEPSRPADIGNVIIILLCGLVGAVSLIAWAGQAAGLDFNASKVNLVWSLFSLALSLLGMLLLYRLRPLGRGFGLAIFTILFFGEVGHLTLAGGVGDFAGYVRLAQLAAFPLLLALPSRFPTLSVREFSYEEMLKKAGEQSDEDHPQTPPKAADPKVTLAFLSLASESDPDEICKSLTWAISQALLADLSLLVVPAEEDGSFTVRCGYDLIREEPLGGGTFDSALVPKLYAAIKNGRSARYTPKTDSPDALGFKELLGLEDVGTVLAVPIGALGSEPLATIALLTPYSGHEWSRQDQLTLESYSPLLAGILERYQYELRVQEQIELTNQKYETALARAEAAEADKRDSPGGQNWGGGLEDRSGSPAINLDNLRQSHQDALKNLEQLHKENDALRASLASLQAVAAAEWESDELEDKLTEALAEVAELQGELAEARDKLARLEGAPQPAASPPSVDLSTVIDEAIQGASDPLRQKQIILRVDIPEGLPEIALAHDPLDQIVLHLLKNAAAASRQEGEVSLYASLQPAYGGEEGDFVLMQVADSGPGIPPGEIAHVFSRPYPPGDSAAGLPIAKSLVEAAGGRIWIDSQVGSGATFSVLLPVSQAEPQAGLVEAGGAQA